MRILLLSQYHSPEPAFKSRMLGAELVRMGHHVTALTGFPNYPGGSLYPGYRQRLWSRENMDGTRVLRIPLYPDHSKSSVRRALNYLSFAASASTLGPIVCGPADVMWVYHPPLTVGIPACVIAALRRIPFVYEVQDMWPETLKTVGMIHSSHILKGLAGMARLIYRRAAAITVHSPGFKRNLIAKGVPEGKIHIIPNWADEEIYRVLPREESLAIEHGLSHKFNVMYLGNLGAAQALDNVLEAAERLRGLPEIQFVFVGSGVDENRLRIRVNDKGLPNVRFIRRQPESQVPRFLALADVVLVHLKKDPLFEITIPSKTIAYLACGRPVLASVSGDAAEVVQNSGAGLVCNPEDPDALAQTVRRFWQMPSQQLHVMGNAGRCAFINQYARTVLMRRYEELFVQIAEQNGSVRHSTAPQKRLA
jgi:glycosyltransferase involved in cell wall biosynthesis